MYEVGSALTFFQVRNYVDEYIHAINGNRNPPVLDTDTDETVASTADEIIESTKDFILKELSRNLKGIWVGGICR